MPYAVAQPKARKSWYSTITDLGVQDGLQAITISTAGVDRDGDTLQPEGMQLRNFTKNPVLIWGHDYHSLPIGTVPLLHVLDGDRVQASFRWLDGDPFAARVKNAWDQGVVRAASIGFKPLTWQETKTGYQIDTWELLEVSLVPVPANADAVRTLKSLDLVPPDLPEPPADPTPDPPVVPPAEAGTKASEVVPAPSLPVEAPGLDASPVPPDASASASAPPPSPKAGRIQAARNEARLRQMVTLLTDMLNELAAAPDDEKPCPDDDDDDRRAAVIPETKTAEGADAPPAAPVDSPVLPVSDPPVLDLVDAPHPPISTFEVDEAQLTTQMAAAVRAAATTAVAREFARACGRLDDRDA